MLVAITCSRAAFTTNKAAQIVALGLLYVCTDTCNSIFTFFSKWTVFSERVTFIDVYVDIQTVIAYNCSHRYLFSILFFQTCCIDNKTIIDINLLNFQHGYFALVQGSIKSLTGDASSKANRILTVYRHGPFAGYTLLPYELLISYISTKKVLVPFDL